MSEINSFNQASQYLHNIRRVVGSSANTAAAPVLAAAFSLAEAYLSLDPYTTSKVECDAPIFFLHNLWCNSGEQGIEQAVGEFETALGEDAAVQINILSSLRNVLYSAKLVSQIREDLRDPGNINNAIHAALLYAFFTSSNDWDEMEERDCFDIFISEAWGADDREKQRVAASNLQAYIENSSIDPSESIFEALYSGQVTTPNTLWDED